MKRRDEEDVFRTHEKTPADLGPLFADLEGDVLDAGARSIAADIDRLIMGEPEPPEPPPPHKPEPPTKLERIAAIERLKVLVQSDLVARALKRVGLPLPVAGVTADDVWELAQGIPSAALLGQEARAWSWTGPWLQSLARAGALSPFYVETIPVTRRATSRAHSHGNAHRVYLHPTDARAAGGPRSGRPDA